MPLIKVNKKLQHCHLFQKRLGLQSLEISFTFKFSFILKLLSSDETWINTNSIHMSLISNWFTHAVEQTIKQPPCTCSNPSQHFQTSFKTNFFGECEEIESNLHSIVLTLLHRVWVLSVGAKLYVTNFNWLALGKS